MAAVVIVSPLRASESYVLVAEDIAQVGDRGRDFGNAAAAMGLSAKPPTIVATCSV